MGASKNIKDNLIKGGFAETLDTALDVAIDGAEAWQRIPDIDPDVIVSDVEMPKMNGIQLIQEIKNNVMCSKFSYLFNTKERRRICRIRKLIRKKSKR